MSKATGGYIRLDDLNPRIKKYIKSYVPQHHYIDTSEHMFVKEQYRESVSGIAARNGITVSWEVVSNKSDLFLTEDAPDFLVKAVWKVLAAKYHPDKPEGDEKLFNKYKKAYENIKE